MYGKEGDRQKNITQRVPPRFPKVEKRWKIVFEQVDKGTLL